MVKPKIALVTGYSGQLGPVWVDTLGELGYKVYGIGLPECDISDIAQKKNMAGKLPGVPDIIVLNAAIDNPPGSGATFHGNFQRIMEVNIGGAVNVVDVFLRSMIENGGGVIVGISSIQAHIGADWRNYEGDFEKPVGYNCSKAALEQYARSLTVQYGRYNIRACCIAFGPYDGGKLDKTFLGKFLLNVPLFRPVSKASLKAAFRFAIECPEFAGQTAIVDGGYIAL